MMKTKCCLIVGFLFAVLSAFAQDPGWPRQLTNNGSILVLYTPQVESWPDYQTIDFRMAFSLTPAQGTQMVGVMYIHATTFVNTYD